MDASTLAGEDGAVSERKQFTIDLPIGCTREPTRDHYGISCSDEDSEDHRLVVCTVSEAKEDLHVIHNKHIRIKFRCTCDHPGQELEVKVLPQAWDVDMEQERIAYRQTLTNAVNNSTRLLLYTAAGVALSVALLVTLVWYLSSKPKHEHIDTN